MCVRSPPNACDGNNNCLVLVGRRRPKRKAGSVTRKNPCGRDLDPNISLSNSFHYRYLIDFIGLLQNILWC